MAVGDSLLFRATVTVTLSRFLVYSTMCEKKPFDLISHLNKIVLIYNDHAEEGQQMAVQQICIFDALLYYRPVERYLV